MELKYQTYLNHISCIIMFIQDSLAADLRLKTTNGVREVREIKPQIVKSKIFNSEQKKSHYESVTLKDSFLDFIEFFFHLFLTDLIA